MLIIPLAVGGALTVVGLLGVLRPDDWASRYQRMFDDMPKCYRSSNAWQGSSRDLAIRLSVVWLITGLIFIGAALAISFG